MVSCAGRLFRSGGELFREARETKQSAARARLVGAPSGGAGLRPKAKTRRTPIRPAAFRCSAFHAHTKCDNSASVTMSRPQRPEAEERHVLDATARSLPPMSARISAISHAEHDSPFTIENGRHFVANTGPLENDEGVRGRTDIDFARARPRLECRMAEAALGMSLVEHR